MSQPPIIRPTYLAASARSAIGSAHGALSGWHPIGLLANVVDTVLTKLGDTHVDRLIVANATPVGALASPLQSLAATGYWYADPAKVDGLEVSYGSASGHRALLLAAEQVAAGLAETIIVCGVDMASVVPPGAPLLRRDYGKPWPADALRKLTAAGKHLPDGPYGDTLGIDRLAADGFVAKQAAAAQAWPATTTPTTSFIADPERARPYQGPDLTVDEPLRRDLSHEALSALAPMFDLDHGIITAASLAQPGDGAVAVVVSATPADWQIISRAAHGGLPTQPLHAAVGAYRALDQAEGTIATNQPTSAHTLALAELLGAEVDTINPHGGSLARGQLDGVESLQALHDLTTGNLASHSLTLLSTTGNGAALATQFLRHPS